MILFIKQKFYNQNLLTEKSSHLLFEFSEKIKGYLLIGDICTEIDGNSCAVDVRGLKVGEYNPILILEDYTVDLPKIKNENGAILPKGHSIDEIAEVSLRERRLSRRVDELEERLEKINKKVFGTSIF